MQPCKYEKDKSVEIQRYKGCKDDSEASSRNERDTQKVSFFYGFYCIGQKIIVDLADGILKKFFIFHLTNPLSVR